MIKTLLDTILWIAEERLEQNRYSNLNSAIYSVLQEVSNEVLNEMKKVAGDLRNAISIK